MTRGEAGEPQTVFANVTDSMLDRVRITAVSPDALFDAITDALSAGTDPRQLLVELDAATISDDGASDVDKVIALAAVLIDHGITAIETVHVRSVRRLFDTHAAIVGGSIEAISS